jgi:rhodanese-related sulfurtransferase
MWVRFCQAQSDRANSASKKVESLRNMPTELATISRVELKKKIDSKEYFFLVETLAPEYYREGHLPGALNLPPDQVRQLASNLLPDKNAEVVVYCAKLT